MTKLLSKTVSNKPLGPRRASKVSGSARHRDGGIGRHHPQRLDFAALDGFEHLHRFQALVRRHMRRTPEPAHAFDVFGGERHMRRQLIGEPAGVKVGQTGRRQIGPDWGCKRT
jgi:hypothetical protein